jgi:hypothetical protein
MTLKETPTARSKMAAFYLMRYAGTVGEGAAAIFIGKGIVVGVDVVGGKYDGSYEEKNGRLKGVVKLTAPTAGAHLVTGQNVSGGQSFVLEFDLPPDFANGRPQTIVGVGGRPVQVIFEKLKDLP